MSIAYDSNGPYANPRSPKRSPIEAFPRCGWYPFYAGFSPSFVADTIAQVTLPAGATVLDPWNGGGTTTLVCSLAGLHSIGYDINPALITVARARALSPNDTRDLNAFLSEIRGNLPSRRPVLPDPSDPLLSWLRPASVSHVRTILSLLLRHRHPTPADGFATLAPDFISVRESFLLLLVFRNLRAKLRRFISNPTWMKIARKPSDRIPLVADHLWDEIVTDGLNLLHSDKMSSAKTTAHISPSISTADSKSLPLPDQSVDLILSSPPYCTRLDYAIATRIELAVLGAKPAGLDALRRAQLGTPRLAPAVPEIDPAWGKTAIQLVDAVRNHRSKASATYYCNFFRHYLAGLYASFRELARVTRRGAPAILVVQASQYKELPVDLPSIVIEMASNCGFVLSSSTRYRAIWNRSTQNPRARAYIEQRATSEVALRFCREGT